MKNSPRLKRPIMAPSFTEVTPAGVPYVVLCGSLDGRVASVNDDGSYFCPRCWEWRDLIDWRKDSDAEPVALPWKWGFQQI